MHQNLVSYFNLTDMSSDQSPPTPASRGGMSSLYANLLGPSASSSAASISSAPVVYKQSSGNGLEQDEASAKKQINAGRFTSVTQFGIYL
jgi:hypothetical protein